MSTSWAPRQPRLAARAAPRHQLDRHSHEPAARPADERARIRDLVASVQLGRVPLRDSVTCAAGRARGGRRVGPAPAQPQLSSFEDPRPGQALRAKITEARPTLVRGYPSSIAVLARMLRTTRGRAAAGGPHLLRNPARRRPRSSPAPSPPVLDYGQMERVAFIGMCQGPLPSSPSMAWLGRRSRRRRAAGRRRPARRHRPAPPPCLHPLRHARSVGSPRTLLLRPRLHTVERIMGRLEDWSSPRRSSRRPADAAFKYSPGIRLAQIVQNQVEAITVRIAARRATATPTPGRWSASFAAASARPSDRPGLVDSIPTTPTGKPVRRLDGWRPRASPGAGKACERRRHL